MSEKDEKLAARIAALAIIFILFVAGAFVTGVVLRYWGFI